MDLPIAGVARQHDGDIVLVAMVFIKGQFVPDPETDEEGHGHTHGQAKDIYKGIDPIFSKVATGDPDIAAQHADEFGK